MGDDIDEQIERLRRCELLKESEIKSLCDKAREILIDESNIQRVNAPVTVSVGLFFEKFIPNVDMWRYSRTVP